MNPISLVIFLSYLVGVTKGVIVDETDTIDAPGGFTPTPALGDLSVFQAWYDICDNDSVCREKFGISSTTTLEEFVHIVTIIDPFSGPVDFEENPRVYNIYGKTLKEVEDLIIVLQLKTSFLSSNFVCGINEKPKVEDGTIKCKPKPGKIPSESLATSATIYILLICGGIFLLVTAGKTAYTLTKKSEKMAIEAYKRDKQRKKNPRKT